ncbi:uncharacterized protein TNCV_4467281 [Trichonephila clavipes]|nr:uncharacterized protein TNCV_4467281 [Trichonephila clavipes]
MHSNLGILFDSKKGTESILVSTRFPFVRSNFFLLCQDCNFVAPIHLQLVNLLQVFSKLVRFYHGAVRNVPFLVNVLLQRVGKGSIANVFEFGQRLQGHGKQSQLFEKFLLFRSFDHHEAPSGQLAKLAPHVKEIVFHGHILG